MKKEGENGKNSLINSQFSMKRIIILIFISLSSLFVMNAVKAFSFPWVDKDKALLEVLQSSNFNRLGPLIIKKRDTSIPKSKYLNKFEQLLKDGTNPNAILDKQSTDWVMCLARDCNKICVIAYH